MTLNLGAGVEPALSVFAGLRVTSRLVLLFLWWPGRTQEHSRGARGRKIAVWPAIFSTRISTEETQLPIRGVGFAQPGPRH